MKVKIRFSRFVVICVTGCLLLASVSALAHTQDCRRVKRLGLSFCSSCQPGDQDATQAWKKNPAGTFAECSLCLNKLCGQGGIEPRNSINGTKEAQGDDDTASCYGLVEPSLRLTLRHLDATLVMVERAAKINPYAAVAMFGVRPELSSAEDPNSSSIDPGNVILERSFSAAEVMAVVNAGGKAPENLGRPLPKGAFINILSEREAALDTQTESNVGGFRISTFIEEQDGSRAPLGSTVVLLVGNPIIQLADTGERVETYPVVDVIAVPSR